MIKIEKAIEKIVFLITKYLLIEKKQKIVYIL